MLKKGFTIIASPSVIFRRLKPAATSGLSLTGFTIIEMMIAMAIIVLLIALAVPSFIKSRGNVYKDMCINNLRQIKLAKSQWALENNKPNSAVPSAANLDPYVEDDIWNESGGTYTTGHKLVCPLNSGGTVDTSYNINNVSTDPTYKIKPSEHHL